MNLLLGLVFGLVGVARNMVERPPRPPRVWRSKGRSDFLVYHLACLCEAAYDGEHAMVRACSNIGYQYQGGFEREHFAFYKVSLGEHSVAVVRGTDFGNPNNVAHLVLSLVTRGILVGHVHYDFAKLFRELDMLPGPPIVAATAHSAGAVFCSSWSVPSAVFNPYQPAIKDIESTSGKAAEKVFPFLPTHPMTVYRVPGDCANYASAVATDYWIAHSTEWFDNASSTLTRSPIESHRIATVVANCRRLDLDWKFAREGPLLWWSIISRHKHTLFAAENTKRGNDHVLETGDVGDALKAFFAVWFVDRSSVILQNRSYGPAFGADTDKQGDPVYSVGECDPGNLDDWTNVRERNKYIFDIVRTGCRDQGFEWVRLRNRRHGWLVVSNDRDGADWVVGCCETQPTDGSDLWRFRVV